MQAARPNAPSPHDAETLVASQTAATRIAPALDAPSLPELEDVLYDLLAAGELSLSSEKLERVQAFLHEHARQRKTQAQFVVFFQEQALSMRPERPNLLSLPLVEASSRSGAARVPPLFTAAPEASVAEAEPEPIYVESRSRTSWGWLAAAVVVVSGVLALGVAGVLELRAELSELNQTVTRNTLELQQLRAESQQLRDLVRGNTEAVQRTERDAQQLVERLIVPPMQNSR
jgi:hypothetical protein